MRANATKPAAAMVLAAGLGKRMRPITDTIPKPLVRVAGKTLLDWGLDSLAEAGVSTAVVNVHYFPEQIVAHVAGRAKPAVSISDESVELLDSGGGVAKALPLARWDAVLHYQRRHLLDRPVRLKSRQACPCMGPFENGYVADAGGSCNSATGHNGKSDFLLSRRRPAFALGGLRRKV